jgi:peptidoglycan/LPS O-acetylase OafA/YrhL
LREYRQYGSIDVKAFYARRILRIWPLYFAFLLVVVPILNATLPRQHLTVGYLAAFLMLAGNWACAIKGPPISSARPLWSVSIEEQFYLIWPLIMSRWIRRIGAIAIGMLIVASASRLALIVFRSPHPGTWYNTLTRLDPLAIGILAAVWLDRREWAPSGWRRVSLASVGLALIYAAGLWGGLDGLPALYSYPLVALGSGMVIMSVLGIRLGGGWIVRSLAHLGKISYGLYVFHVACLDVLLKEHPSLSGAMAARCGGFLLTIGIGMLSYRYFESPFLRLKDKFTRVLTRPA